MTETNKDHALERRIALALDTCCERTDACNTPRLDQARRKALQQEAAPRRARWPGPALAAACLVLVALVVSLRPADEPAPMTADLDLLTRPEFEVFLENPEFFAWVAQTEEREPAPPGSEEEHSG